MSALMESGCDILHIAYKSPAINPHQETRRMQYCQTPDSNIYVDLLQNTTFLLNFWIITEVPLIYETD